MGFTVSSDVLPDTANHQTLIIGPDAVFESDSNGVRVQLSPAFGHSVVISLCGPACQKLMKVWQSVDTVYLPF
jgi:hypothetical protein